MRLNAYRRITQVSFVLFLFLMPVFDILRYDTATKDLYLFGSTWSLGIRDVITSGQQVGGSGYVAVQIFLKAILPWLIVLSVFPLLGTLFGRFFCGWLCLEGALFELADFFSMKIRGGQGNRFLYGAAALLVVFTLPPLTGIALTGYFIAPATIWEQIKTGQLSTGVKAGMIGVSVYMFITSVFVRHIFCKYVCAAGLMQMLFGWLSPVSLRIKFDRENADRCTDCRGCEKACFMGVRPRQPKRDINCVNCGKCIEACRKELGEGNLFGYTFGNNEIHLVVRAEPRMPQKPLNSA